MCHSYKLRNDGMVSQLLISKSIHVDFLILFIFLKSLILLLLLVCLYPPPPEHILWILWEHLE